jgi:hypothetical protein
MLNRVFFEKSGEARSSYCNFIKRTTGNTKYTEKGKRQRGKKGKKERGEAYVEQVVALKMVVGLLASRLRSLLLTWQDMKLV